MNQIETPQLDERKLTISDRMRHKKRGHTDKDTIGSGQSKLLLSECPSCLMFSSHLLHRSNRIESSLYSFILCLLSVFVFIVFHSDQWIQDSSCRCSCSSYNIHTECGQSGRASKRKRRKKNGQRVASRKQLLKERKREGDNLEASVLLEEEEEESLQKMWGFCIHYVSLFKCVCVCVCVCVYSLCILYPKVGLGKWWKKDFREHIKSDCNGLE